MPRHNGWIWRWCESNRCIKKLQSRRHDPNLIEILALLLIIRGFALLVALEEQHLPNTLVGVDSGRQRCAIRELQRHIAAPAGLEWRCIQNDPTARVCRFPKADRQDIARNAEKFYRASERE